MTDRDWSLVHRQSLDSLTKQSQQTAASQRCGEIHLDNMVLAGGASRLAVYKPGHEALQHGQLLEQGFGSQRSHSRLLPCMLLLLYSKC